MINDLKRPAKIDPIAESSKVSLFTRFKLSVFGYIEDFYDSKRPHGSLGMMPPNEKKELFWNQA